MIEPRDEMRFATIFPALLLATTGLLSNFAAAAESKAPAAALDPKVQAYFEQHCLKCHDADAHKGDFRIDNLSPKVGSMRDRSPATTQRWERLPACAWKSAWGVICVAWMTDSFGNIAATRSIVYDLPLEDCPCTIPAKGRRRSRLVPIM